MNSTTTPSGPLAGLAQSAISNLSRYRPELETLFVLALYSPFLAHAFSFSSARLTRARRFPYLPMLIHIFVGPLTDLALLVVFNVSSFLLELHRSKGDHTTAVIRSGFQAAVLTHAIIFAASWYGGKDAGLYRASAKFFNWFAWFRVTSKSLPVFEPRLGQMRNLATKYELTMVLSLAVAVWEAGVPAGVPAIMAIFATLLLGERAMARILLRYPDDSPLKQLVLSSGYVDLNYIKAHSNQPTESKEDPGDGTKVEL